MVLAMLSIECIDVCGKGNIVMKYKIKIICSLFVLIVITLFDFSGCKLKQIETEKDNGISPPYVTLDKTKEDNDSYGALSNIDVIYEDEKNYRIYSNKEQTMFYYEVFDDYGSPIDFGYHNWRGSFGIQEKNKILILEYGSGGPLWSCRYYDTSKGKVSRFFPRPLQISDELVAYFDAIGEDQEILLVVQNMFDSTAFYKEFYGDFSVQTMLGDNKAEFLDNNSKLRVTYWSNDVESTKVFELDE